MIRPAGREALAGSVGLFGAAHQPDPRRRRIDQTAVGGEVVQRHAAGGEAGLELPSDRIAVQGREAADGGDGAGFVLDDEAGQALIDDFGDGAAVIGNDGSATGHRFDHHEADLLLVTLVTTGTSVGYVLIGGEKRI